jgi:hypothetical protein
VSGHGIFYQQGTPRNSHILKKSCIKPGLHGPTSQSSGPGYWLFAGLRMQLWGILEIREKSLERDAFPSEENMCSPACRFSGMQTDCVQ